MSKMRVVQVAQANGPFELVEREVPEPAAYRHQDLLVRRNQHLQGHVADGQMVAAGRDTPAIE